MKATGMTKSICSAKLTSSATTELGSTLFNETERCRPAESAKMHPPDDVVLLLPPTFG